MLGQVIHTLPVVEINQTHPSYETVVKSHVRESQTINF